MSRLADKIDLYRQLDEKREREGLDDLEEERWQGLGEWLEKAWAGEALPPSSRRSSLRVPMQLEIVFRDARGFERAYLRNVSDGGVYIATGRDLRMGEIEVEDDGPGIPNVLKAAVFDPYVTTKKNGTGLGLSIAQKVVLDHGGTLDVEDAPGGGARFLVRLPIAGTLASEAALSKSHAAAWSTGSRPGLA